MKDSTVFRGLLAYDRIGRRRRPSHRRIAGAALLAAGLLLAAAAPAKESPPAPGPPRPVHIPSPIESRLPNGLRVIIIPRHTVPLIAADLIIKTGAEADPPGRSGTAHMVADLLTQGAGGRTAPQIARTIDALGASIDAGADWDMTRVTVSAMTPKFSRALDIFADLVRRPDFAAAEIERKRTQALNDLALADSDPEDLAGRVADRVIYGGGPYGHPIQGTRQSIRAIDRADIVRFHQAYFRPDDAILLFGGDIDPDAALAEARRVFGDWTAPAASSDDRWADPGADRASSRGALSGPSSPPQETAGVARVVVVDQPGAGRAAIVAGRITLARTSPDYYTGITANGLLSGYSGRLNREIRIKRGLSYGADSAIEARRSPGPFAASTLVDNAKVAESVSVMLDAIASLSREPAAADELAARKASLIGGFSRSLETVNGLLGRTAALADYGLPLSDLGRYTERVEAVTPGEIRDFAGRYLTQGLSIVIVGDARQFIDDLRKRYPQVTVIPSAQLDLDSGSVIG